MNKVLLLNASYEPLNLITKQRAIKLMFLNKIQVLHESSEEWKSMTMAIKVPSVVRLLNFINHRRFTKIRYSKKNVFIRDNWTCQYCNKQPIPDELTIDHVVPRRQGGKTSFENTVACCRKCNLEKDDRRPHEAGMKLRSRPKEPMMILLTLRIQRFARIPEEWEQYMLAYNN